MEIFRKLLEKWACCHEWESFKEIDTYESSESTKPYRVTFLMYCHKCGKIKKITV